ncbi:hypothetical protein PSQ90_04145 [Devosia rhodophyticola]|uniref:Uncharacterized protein n=1 Tax=Devosia rhodophyticola TaxID=3026423 RepID=A0ABY7YZJ2_9HYPH|nr:hypothetical protein [Devosia rhodophyticola]WDR06662.1 hypothetical protein PSQ90_04145 [Devosia rhodophyticola]
MADIDAHSDQAKDIDPAVAKARRMPIITQLFNGVAGLLTLLIGGIVVLIVVLWKAP